LNTLISFFAGDKPRKSASPREAICPVSSHFPGEFTTVLIASTCQAQRPYAASIRPTSSVREGRELTIKFVPSSSVAYPLRFQVASRSALMAGGLGIVYRCIATHPMKKAGFSHKTDQIGAVTLLQRFGSALNLNAYFHMMFLDGVYIERPDG